MAIVTGASRGIGAAVAERLAADGFTVVINYSGNAAPAEELARKIEASGGRALTAKADVSDAEAVRHMFDAAEAAFGGVDVLVNNAGIMKLATIADSDDALFDRQIGVNLKGTFNTLREAAKRCATAAGSSISRPASSGLKLETYGVYVATKAAVETMTAIMSKEMRGRFDHRQRGRARADRDRSVPRRQVGGTRRAHGEDEPAGAARHARRTSPPPSPSSSAPTAPGSTARCCAPMAEWSESQISPG